MVLWSKVRKSQIQKDNIQWETRNSKEPGGGKNKQTQRISKFQLRTRTPCEKKAHKPRTQSKEKKAII